MRPLFVLVFAFAFIACGGDNTVGDGDLGMPDAHCTPNTGSETLTLDLEAFDGGAPPCSLCETSAPDSYPGWMVVSCSPVGGDGGANQLLCNYENGYRCP